MTIWKRDKIRELFKDLDCSVEEKDPGGDWDIVGFFIVPNDSKEWISVIPFKDPFTDPDEEVQDNCEIYAIEVRTNGDCTGGLQTEDEKVGIAYGRICARLSKEGFNIIAHYDEIF